MAWPISAAMAAAQTARNRQRIFRADVLQNGTVIYSGLRVSTGTVTVNGSSDPRRSASITCIDDAGDLVPGEAADLLAPYGNELAIYRGLIVDGAPEQIPLGVMRIQKSDAKWAGGVVSVQLSASDRSQRVIDDLFTDYFTVADGTNLATAIMQLVSPALPANQVYNFAPCSTTITSQTYAPGDNRWSGNGATSLAAAGGFRLYFDQTAALVLTPVTDPALVAPAAVLAPGQASVLTTAEQTLDRSNAKNIVVVTLQGSAIDTPLVAVAMDEDPSSPTYVGGNFGNAVLSISSSTLTTIDDGQTYATSQLLLQKGATQQAQLSSIVLEQLDANDVIELAVPKVKLNNRYVLDQLSIPIDGPVMTMTTRGIVVGTT